MASLSRVSSSKVSIADVIKGLKGTSRIWGISEPSPRLDVTVSNVIRSVIATVSEACNHMDTSGGTSHYAPIARRIHASLAFIESWSFPESDASRRRNLEIEQVGTFILFSHGFVFSALRPPRNPKTFGHGASCPCSRKSYSSSLVILKRRGICTSNL